MREPLDKGAELLVVALAQSGDQDAFTELVRRRQEWMRNLMRRLSRDVTLADDLAQQTFLEAWRDISKLQEPKKFAGWLKRIAINVWMKHQRKNDPLYLAQDADDLEVNDSKPTVRPDVAMDLDGALATLSHLPRLCIVLAYHEGMKHNEIAELLDLPMGTVKSHI